MKNEYILKTLYNLSVKAAKKNEVPISALIIKDNKILTKTFNKRENEFDVTAHAEILCIKKAAKKLKRWNSTIITLLLLLIMGVAQ